MNDNRQKFEQFWDVYEEAFPDDERRTLKGQKSIMKDPKYNIVDIEIENNVVGFCAMWELNSVKYIEHIAINRTHRGMGIGASLIKNIINELDEKYIVLEVEPPESEINKRRITFYERLGFKLNNYEYIQPPLAKGKSEVQLMIMSYPNKLKRIEFENIRREIYKDVFKIER